LPISAITGLLIEGEGLLGILWNADPIFIHHAETEAASHIPTIARFPVKRFGLTRVLWPPPLLPHAGHQVRDLLPVKPTRQ
jgi:hypothetical protein